jgi:peroxiredoxin Q/BCP
MAQLRRDYDRIAALDTEVIVVGPENRSSFAAYFGENDLPFIGLPDPNHSVLRLYGQEVNLFKLGRMPAQVIVDRSGIARYVHYGKAMSDIPENDELLALLEELNRDTALLAA